MLFYVLSMAMPHVKLIGEFMKITFDRISRHFRSIRNFNFFLIFFHKMTDGVHLGSGKSLSMTGNHFRSQFSPFQINTQLLLSPMVLSHAVPKALDGRYFNTPPPPPVRLSVHPSRLVFAL